jgi:hypothetical protein
MPYSQREQAVSQAALAVLQAYNPEWDASMEDVAERLVRGADRHTVTGPRGEVFEWYFDYGDVPEIAARAAEIAEEAREILAGGAGA